jgi:hypothetical protein
VEPVPIPFAGDGIFGGRMYDSWIDFNPATDRNKVLHLVFSKVSWTTVKPTPSALDGIE